MVTMGYVSSAMEKPTSSLGKRSLFSASRKPTRDTRTHTQTDCTGARAGVEPPASKSRQVSQACFSLGFALIEAILGRHGCSRGCRVQTFRAAMHHD